MYSGQGLCLRQNYGYDAGLPVSSALLLSLAEYTTAWLRLLLCFFFYSYAQISVRLTDLPGGSGSGRGPDAHLI